MTNSQYRALKSLLSHLRSIFDIEASGRLIMMAPWWESWQALGAAGFFWLLDLTQAFTLGHVEGYIPPSAGDEGTSQAWQFPTHAWAVLLVPALGGLLCGLLVYGLAPEAEGHGTDAMVKAFHRLGGRIRARVPFVKAFASIITIGTGGSAGREGPIAQIGAGFRILPGHENGFG